MLVHLGVATLVLFTQRVVVLVVRVPMTRFVVRSFHSSESSF